MSKMSINLMRPKFQIREKRRWLRGSLRRQPPRTLLADEPLNGSAPGIAERRKGGRRLLRAHEDGENRHRKARFRLSGTSSFLLHPCAYMSMILQIFKINVPLELLIRNQ